MVSIPHINVCFSSKSLLQGKNLLKTINWWSSKLLMLIESINNQRFILLCFRADKRFLWLPALKRNKTILVIYFLLFWPLTNLQCFIQPRIVHYPTLYRWCNNKQNCVNHLRHKEISFISSLDIVEYLCLFIFWFYISNNQRWSRGHKARGQGQGHKKNPRPRPRTAFPRTDTLEAKDRNARGQGPRTQAQVLSKKKKKGLHKNFSGDLKKKKRSSQKFASDLPKKTFSKKFCKRSTKF